MQPGLGGAACPVPCGLATVLARGGAVLAAAVSGTGLSGLVGQGVLGVTGAGATVGAAGTSAAPVTSKIQSRSLVTRV